jgi:hypothetical protein
MLSESNANSSVGINKLRLLHFIRYQSQFRPYDDRVQKSSPSKKNIVRLPIAIKQAIYLQFKTLKKEDLYFTKPQEGGIATIGGVSDCNIYGGTSSMEVHTLYRAYHV